MGEKGVNPLDRLHHVAVAVPDVRAALAWYRREFNVRVAYEDETWALLQFDNVALALVVPGQHPPHLAVERPDAERHGPLKTHRDGTASIYVHDPAGNTVEIMKKVEHA